jgi:hypothetical protein
MKAPCAYVVALGLLLSILSPIVCLDQRSDAQSNKSQSEIRRGAAPPAITLCTICIRAHVEFLASDALRGRGSGTGDELIAATYAASELRAYGIEPAGADGSYLQRANLLRYKFTAAPQLKIAGSASTPAVSFTYGPDFQVIQLTQPSFSGPVVTVNADEAPFEIKNGAVVLVTGRDNRQKIQ